MVDSLAERVRRSVQELRRPGVYRGLHVEIDLQCAQGRWELLALGVLLAARVSEGIAETTFMRLRDAELLHLGVLVQERSHDQERVNEVLVSEYRGIVDRKEKGAALFANARMLHDEYGGDLNRLYERATQPSCSADGVVGSLQQFRQIHTRARWLCRAMCEAGIWTGLTTEDTCYYDVHVRRALTRLGLVDSEQPWPIVQERMQEAVATLFGGETTYLYRLGRYRCLSSDLSTCQAQCLAHDTCIYFQRHR